MDELRREPTTEEMSGWTSPRPFEKEWRHTVEQRDQIRNYLRELVKFLATHIAVENVGSRENLPSRTFDQIAIASLLRSPMHPAEISALELLKVAADEGRAYAPSALEHIFSQATVQNLATLPENGISTVSTSSSERHRRDLGGIEIQVLVPIDDKNATYSVITVRQRPDTPEAASDLAAIIRTMIIREGEPTPSISEKSERHAAPLVIELYGDNVLTVKLIQAEHTTVFEDVAQLTDSHKTILRYAVENGGLIPFTDISNITNFPDGGGAIIQMVEFGYLSLDQKQFAYKLTPKGADIGRKLGFRPNEVVSAPPVDYSKYDRLSIEKAIEESSYILEEIEEAMPLVESLDLSPHEQRFIELLVLVYQGSADYQEMPKIAEDLQVSKTDVNQLVTNLRNKQLLGLYAIEATEKAYAYLLSKQS